MEIFFSKANQEIGEIDRFSEQSEGEILGVLRTHIKGLTDEEAKLRLKTYGKNTVGKKRHFIWLRRILSQIKNPVVAILLVSSIVLFIIDYTVDAYIILAALVINLIIALFQEGRVSHAFELLRNVDQSYTSVIRNGLQVKVLIDTVVPGDIVILEAGSKVPADTRILKQNELQIDESILTGEWEPVNKEAITLTNTRPLVEQVNMAWKGTIVVAGTGRGVVVATGVRSTVGKISKELLYESGEKTPLQKQTQSLAQWIMGLILIAVVAIFIIAHIQGISTHDSIITAIAIAIAGIPSGLPAAITFVLVLGMQSVLKNNGLVRNLFAAETLGGITWILTDKTGTLTNGHMTLSEIIFADSRERVDDENITPFGRSVVLNAYLATDGKRLQKEEEGEHETTLTGSSIERALLTACENVCVASPSREQRRAYAPFNSKNRYSSVITEQQSGRLDYFVVGAPETIIDIADFVYKGGRSVARTEQEKTNIETILKEEAKEGRRVIAIGTKQIKEANKEEYQSILEEKDPAITFLALLSLEDSVRSDVPESIKKIRATRVTATMVTGDNVHTALHVAKQSGIITAGDSEEALLGEDIRELSDEALFAKAQTVRVFARMLPEQKSRLLKVLLGRGEVVAMTGDGINDAPALHRASIGIAVASGTDVAKEASDLILLKNSFSTITKSIMEGKKIVRNLKKILIYLLATSFSEAILVAGGLLATAALPITPIQILWANIIEEGFIAFAFAFEKEDDDVGLCNPRDERNNNILSKNVRSAIAVLAITTGLFLFVIYYVLTSFTTLSLEQIQTVMFIAVSVDSIFLALSLKRLNKSIFKVNIFDNWWLLGAISISLILLIIAFVTPALASVLSIVPIPLWALLTIPVSGVFHVLVIEVIKIGFFKKDYMQPNQHLVVNTSNG